MQPADGHRASPDDVRPMADGEADAVAAMLARAFANDPAFNYIYGDPATLMARAPGLFRLLIDSDRRAGRICVTPGAEAVTMWRAPGKAKSGVMEMIAHALPLLNALRGAIPRALAVSTAIEAHFPDQPFWYLHVAGCDPARQGRGLGGAVLRAGLAQVPADVPVYLETATGSNVGLYQRFGFVVTDEWRVGRVGHDGPRFWSMLRPATD